MSYHYETICDRCKKVADEWDCVPPGWVTLNTEQNPTAPEHLCSECARHLNIPPRGFRQLRIEQGIKVHP